MITQIKTHIIKLNFHAMYFNSFHSKKQNKMSDTNSGSTSFNQENTTSFTNENGTTKAAKNKTRIYNLVILDESGSMCSIENAAIAGFNETVGGIRSAQERFADTQEHFVSLLTFCDCKKKLLYDNVPVNKVKPLTHKEYCPCCCTPLYDAMGISLNKLYNEIKDLEDATAVVTVITDGLENASREYCGNDIKVLVERLTNEEGWTFAYIGTNQNVEEVSASISITNFMFFQDNEEDMKRAWRNERNAKMRHYDQLNACFDVECGMSMSEKKASRVDRNRASKFFMADEDFKDRITPDRITTLQPNEVFVFGSDITGTHRGGAAATAVAQFGAIVCQAEGWQGQSYAIPTTGCDINETKDAVERFIKLAQAHPETKFYVTRIGCGRAGYRMEDIADLFVYASRCPNICLPVEFWKVIM